MAKQKKQTGLGTLHESANLDLLLRRADEQWRAGNLRSALRSFLAAAKAGDVGAQVNLGNFYTDGVGVKPNLRTGLYWYRRAYRRGYAAAAHNIGVMYSKENQPARALAWFERAVRLGDADADLDIGKIHLQRNDLDSARRSLERVYRAKMGSVTEAAREEAQGLLKTLN
jgi:TPR repeat protein